MEYQPYDFLKKILSFTEKISLISAFTGYETNNKYEILNSLGQRVYHAVEGELRNEISQSINRT